MPSSREAKARFGRSDELTQFSVYVIETSRQVNHLVSRSNRVYGTIRPRTPRKKFASHRAYRCDLRTVMTVDGVEITAQIKRLADSNHLADLPALIWNPAV